MFRFFLRGKLSYKTPKTNINLPANRTHRINDTDVMFEEEDKENQEYFDFDDVAEMGLGIIDDGRRSLQAHDLELQGGNNLVFRNCNCVADAPQEIATSSLKRRSCFPKQHMLNCFTYQ